MFDDRLEVDSPGSFAGMVKKENIRYTHFSRNPKIATFLKDYGFVKEYGEGVDRMCRELNAIGLPDPVFDNNTFILKTTICSAAYEKLPIGQTKVTDSGEKLVIEHAKVTDSGEKLPIGEETVTDLLQKLPFDDYKNACLKLGYSETSIEKLNRVYDLIEINQVVGSLYIMKRRAHNESKTCNMDTVFVHAGCFQYSMRRAPCVVSEGVSVEGDGGAQPPQYPVASFREWLGPEKPHFS